MFLLLRTNLPCYLPSDKQPFMSKEKKMLALNLGDLLHRHFVSETMLVDGVSITGYSLHTSKYSSSVRSLAEEYDPVKCVHPV
jgi:hypothetical protein